MPNVFVKVFLAVYVPEEHFYLDKMVPLLRGKLYAKNNMYSCHLIKDINILFAKHLYNLNTFNTLRACDKVSDNLYATDNVKNCVYLCLNGQ